MRDFTPEEIQESLKDDMLHMTIVSCLFLRDTDKIELDLQEQNRSSLAMLITSTLRPEAVKELIAKKVIENDELTNIGLAHVHVFIQEHHLIKQMEESAKAATNQEDIDRKSVENLENEIKAIIYLSLSKFDLEDITQLYNEKNEKILTYYLAKHMNDAGIKKLLEYEIVTLQNTITELGWREIENYVKLNGGVIAEQLASQPLKEPETNFIQAQQDQKKWWEFWK